MEEYEQISYDNAKQCYECNQLMAHINSCGRYVKYTSDECLWYHTIQNDIKKYEANKILPKDKQKSLTFGGLERVLKEKENDV